jgi:hypothetical protein
MDEFPKKINVGLQKTGRYALSGRMFLIENAVLFDFFYFRGM